MSAKREASKKQIRQRERRIAFFAPTGSERVNRIIEGVLRYQSEYRHCVVREFRYNAREPEDRERWAQRPRPWDSWAPDGLLVNVSIDPGLAEWVTAGGQPVVNTGTGPEELTSVFVSASDVAGKAIEHFRSCGLSNFAFVTQEHFSRLGNFFAARLKEIGTTPLHVQLAINPTDWDFTTEEVAARDADLLRMLLSASKPLAVLANNDEVGRVVCMAAQRVGMSVPGEVAVLCMGNYAVSRTAIPPLSSIHQPGEEIGYRGMQLLERMIQGQSVPRCVEIPSGQVVVRQTTGVAGAGGHEAAINRALQIIRDRACEGIGIKEILATLDISAATLHREFKRIVGRSPKEEVLRVRLERAQEMLRAHGYSLTQIAAATGYASLNNFAVFFKAQTGLSPMEYRLKHEQPTRSSL